jgi:hypothetical protein
MSSQTRVNLEPYHQSFCVPFVAIPVNQIYDIDDQRHPTTQSEDFFAMTPNLLKGSQLALPGGSRIFGTMDKFAIDHLSHNF